MYSLQVENPKQSFALIFLLQILRPYEVIATAGKKKRDYTYTKGTTAVVSEEVNVIEN